MSGRGLAVRIVALLARAFPGRGGEREELVAAFERGWRRRRAEGGAAAVGYLLASALDVVRAGWGERRRRRDAGAPRPRGTLNGGGGGMGRTGSDVRYALRVLRRSPGFTAAAVVVLALGIGGNAAVFSALRAVILAPPPWPEADRLVLPKIARTNVGEPDTTFHTFSWVKLGRLREGTSGVLDPVVGYSEHTVTLAEPGDPARVDGEAVDPGYFALLGADPVLGRGFTDDEGGPEAAGVVVVSHALWEERFGGRPDVLGESVVLGRTRLTVVGVAPPRFRGLTGKAELWMTIPDAARTSSRDWVLTETHAHWIHVLARRAPGVSMADARARVAAVGDAIEADLPMADPGQWVGARLRTLDEVRRNDPARTSVVVLTVAAGLVLLIGVANLAALLVARGARRRRETAVRLALGAGRGGIVRGLLAETLLLAGVGGAAGVGVAWLGIEGIARAWPADFVGSANGEMAAVDVGRLALDVEVLLFSLALAVVTGLLFGLVPALRQTGLDLVPALREGGRGGGGEPGSGTRRALVGAQVAIALALLVGAGLMGGTLLELGAVDEGFDSQRLLTLRYDLGRDNPELVDGVLAPAPLERHVAFLERARALPGIEAATLASEAPYSGWGMVTSVSGREGAPPFELAQQFYIGVVSVMPDYFDVLGARWVDGRAFEGAELEAPPRVVVLNRTAVEAIFGGDDPLGRSFSMGIRYEGGDGSYRVVGVVEDILQRGPSEEPMPTAYFPLPASASSRVTLLARTRGHPMDAVPALRAELAALAPGIPLFGISTARDLGAEVVGETRVLAALLLLFAAIALTLAVTGVYGVVAYAVAGRRRELGVRMALGARSGAVSGMVLGEGMRAATLGVAAGLVLSLAGTRLLASLLWGVSAREPAVFAAAALALLGAAALASWIPARRATRLDPSEVLRSE